MPKVIFGTSPASTILRIKLLNSSKSDGSGITGLNFSATGLAISTIKSNESSATYYTAAGSTIETITTLGTYAAPTATKCRFKEIDSTYHKGVYELQLADARFSTTDSLLISIAGASNLAESDFEVQCKNLAADLKAIDGELTNGNNSTLNLKKLNIVNSSGDAVVASGGSGGMGINASGASGIYAAGSTAGMTFEGGTGGAGAVFTGGTAGGNAIDILGHDKGINIDVDEDGIVVVAASGDGARFVGGDAGAGINAVGGVTSGNGMKLLGGTNGTGLWSEGAGTGAGMRAQAGTNAIGFLIQGNQQAGISVASGAGNAPAIEATGTGSGSGVKFTGGTTGHGMELIGSGGDGLKATGYIGAEFTGLNEAGLSLTGKTNGLKSLGDDTDGGGNGAYFGSVTGESKNGSGIICEGQGTGAGLELTSGETGVDLLLTNATHNLFNFIIDGVSTSAIMSNVLSMASGKFDKDSPTPGDVTFYMQDNITPAFTMHITATQRTRTYQAP